MYLVEAQVTDMPEWECVAGRCSALTPPDPRLKGAWYPLVVSTLANIA